MARWSFISLLLISFLLNQLKISSALQEKSEGDEVINLGGMKTEGKPQISLNLLFKNYNLSLCNNRV